MRCRHCGSGQLHAFLDLGFAPHSNRYLTYPELKGIEKTYPLKVLVCQVCWLVQTEDYASSSDLFREDFPNYEEDYYGFKRFIEDRFSQNMYFRQLINAASNVTFYPVFYYTKKVNGEYIPLRDENKNVYIFGFDKFMDSLTID